MERIKLVYRKQSNRKHPITMRGGGKNSLIDITDKKKHTNIYIIGVPEREREGD